MRGLSVAVVFMVSGLVACAPKSPEEFDFDQAMRKQNAEMDAELERAKREANEEIAKAAAPVIELMDKAGQPGKVTLAGKIVTKEGGLMPPVTLEVRAGRNSKGQAPLEKSLEPVLTQNSSYVGEREIGKTLLAFGCESESVAATAKERGLEVVKLSSDVAVTDYSVDTLLICGKPDDELQFALSLSLRAKNTILTGVDYTAKPGFGSLNLITSHLTIRGHNRIRFVGNGTLALSQPLNFLLSVRESFVAEGDTSLKIESIGSDAH